MEFLENQLKFIFQNYFIYLKILKINLQTKNLINSTLTKNFKNIASLGLKGE